MRICGFKVRHWRTLTCVILVAAASWSARQIAATAWKSVVGYRTPYTFHQTLPPGSPLVRRVVLIVLDGVRLDLSQRMPFLNSLRRQGADGIARAGQPSLSNPSRAVLVTGAWPEIHGVTFNSGYSPITVDTIFSLARTAGMKTAVSARFWRTNFVALGAGAFPRYPKELHGAEPDAYVEHQKKSCDGLPELIRNSPAQFLVVDLNAMDDASHDLGPLSAGASKVLQQVDGCLASIAGAVDLKETVLVATADHGHIDTGGHGGTEEIVLRVPLVIAGGPVLPGARVEAQQTDIAPTICALLGLPFPATNQGRVLHEILPEASRSDIEARLQKQVAAFREFQTRLLGGPPEQARDRDRQGRTVPAAVGTILLFALCMWLLWAILLNTSERRGATAALVVFYLIYFAMFKLSGLAYSFSAVNREEYLPQFFLKNMLAAGAALTVAAFAAGWFVPGSNLAGRLRVSAALTTLVVASLAVQLVAIYWINGIFMTYWMLDLSWGIQAYFALLAIHALGFAMLLTPLTLYGGEWLRSRVS